MFRAIWTCVVDHIEHIDVSVHLVHIQLVSIYPSWVKTLLHGENFEDKILPLKYDLKYKFINVLILFSATWRLNFIIIYEYV